MILPLKSVSKKPKRDDDVFLRCSRDEQTRNLLPFGNDSTGMGVNFHGASPLPMQTGCPGDSHEENSLLLAMSNARRVGPRKTASRLPQVFMNSSTVAGLFEIGLGESISNWEDSAFFGTNESLYEGVGLSSRAFEAHSGQTTPASTSKIGMLIGIRSASDSDCLRCEGQKAFQVVLLPLIPVRL